MTESPSQLDIVTLAVFLLGGDVNPIDTEDVAVKAHELAPTRFSWRKYPDQINLELVRVFLSDAKKPKNGARLEGSGEAGWTLTPAGKSWAKEAQDHILDADLSRRRQDARGGGLDEQRWRRERDRIVTTQAWRSWKVGSVVSLREAQEVFRIDSYAVGRMRNLKISRMQKLFEGEEEVGRFLTSMATLIEKQGT